MKHLNKNTNEDSLGWKVKGDTESISIPGADLERDVDFKNEINLDADEKNLDIMLFKEFFHYIEGHVEKIDKF